MSGFAGEGGPRSACSGELGELLCGILPDDALYVGAAIPDRAADDDRLDHFVLAHTPQCCAGNLEVLCHLIGGHKFWLLSHLSTLIAAML